MQVWCDWQVTLCDPHLSALEVRFSRRCAIQIDVYLTLPYIQYLLILGTFLNTSSLVTLSIQLLLSILLHIHISKASNLCLSICVSVH